MDDGATRSVKMTLLRWVIDGNDGKLKDRGFYEWIVNQLFESIGAESPQPAV